MDFLQKTVIFCSVLGSAFLVTSPADAASSRAQVIYQRALRFDGSYFHLLSRYRGVIDSVDEEGNTAYCLALKDGNLDVQKFLVSQGANPNHACVKRVNNNQEKNTAREKAGSVRTPQQFNFNSSGRHPYLLGGIALLAIGGGVALAAGGDGGKVEPSELNFPREDEPLPVPEPAGDLVTNPADVFKTEEYLRSNFLSGINAAEAYAHIYMQDENGNFFGHQAGSGKALEKIKVGVLDGGVFANEDIKGKVSKRYDINRFSKGESVWTWANESGSVQAYVVKKDSKYYLFHVHHVWDEDGNRYVDVFEPIWRDKIDDDKFSYHIGVGPEDADKVIDWGMEEDILYDLVKAAWPNISFEDMTLVDAGAGLPGIDVASLDPLLKVDDLMEMWGGELSGLSHGTHVAGIIGAHKNDKGMHGVAFSNAEILGASWDMYSDSKVYDTVKQMVDDGAKVINNSWGRGIGIDEVSAHEITRKGYQTFFPQIWNSYVYAAKNGAVWVQATGNDGRSSPDYYAGMGALNLAEDGYNKSDTEVPYVAVAALDPATASKDAVSGELAWYSNACGSAAGYCLAAPGSEILSTAASDKGNMYLSGTSMAAPVVSGSIALLNGYYPWLSAQNVAYLLLETANKNGVYADSELYGQGALDLEAAVTTPLGDLRLPENESLKSLSSAKESRLYLSGPMQKQVLEAMPKTVTAFDILDRPFPYETEKLITTTHGANANLRNAVSKMAMGGVRETIKDEKTGFQFSSEESLNSGGLANLSSAEVVRDTDTAETRLYYAVNSKYASHDNVLKANYNPYFAMNEAYGAENTLKLSDTSKLKFALQTGENGLYERDYEQDKRSFNERSYALSAEYSFNLTDYLEVATLGGMLFENDAMLGMNGYGMFGIKDSSTYYMGVKAALNLTNDFSILAAYYRGYTQGGDAAMLSISDLETESFMLAGEYKLNKTDKVGLSLSSPLSVVRGKASVLFARGRDSYSDRVYVEKLTSSLKPQAKEYDLGMYYQGKPKENVNLMGKIEARFNADGEKGVTDYIGMVGAGVAF